MAEYIEREALLAELKERHDYVMQDPEISKTMKWCEAVCFGRTKDILDATTAADVVEVVHARWETIPGTKSRKHCTNCDFSGPEYIKFYSHCPNCGARTDGE